MTDRTTQVLVIGSGAGGAVTALELARAGLDVLIVEEGARHSLDSYGASAPEAMAELYRRRGMTPILGKVPIAYVEGSCVGGSTEINSGFWHRAPREVLLRWKARFDLADTAEEDLAPHYAWAEQQLGVTHAKQPWPPSTQAFARGIEKMAWSYQEVPRAAPGCQNTNACAQGCPTGAKQGMSRRIIPEAEQAGARVVTGLRVVQLLRRRRRVTGVVGLWQRSDGSRELVRIDADHIFVCCGPTESPALLLRSGIKYHIGNSLRIHPYLKVAARFDEEMQASNTVLPLLQVKEFWPDISLGGGFFSLGQLAMTLSENWPQTRHAMQDQNRMALYYVGVRGSGGGWVRSSLLRPQTTIIRYQISDEDVRHLSVGLARLAEVLLAAGARAVYPSVWGLPAIESELDAVKWLDDLLPKSALSLVTVHAFSSCPAGERESVCAVNSFGRVNGFDNLFVNDASILPDSPGVNPQGTIMAMARRNALYFADWLAR